MTIADDVDDNDANDDDESSQIYAYCWGLFFRWSLGKLVGLSFSHVDSGKLKYRDSWEPRFLDGDPGKLGKTRVLQAEVEPSHYYWGRMRHHWAIGVLWNMCFSSVDLVKLGKNPRSTSRSRTYRGLQILYLTSWYGSYFHRVMRRDSEVDDSSVSSSSERNLTLVKLSDTNLSVSLRLQRGTAVSLEK